MVCIVMCPTDFLTDPLKYDVSWAGIRHCSVRIISVMNKFFVTFLVIAQEFEIFFGGGGGGVLFIFDFFFFFCFFCVSRILFVLWGGGGGGGGLHVS